MNRLLKFIAVGLVALFFFSCSRNIAPQGHYQKMSVVADGINSNEWEFPLRFANNDYTLSYNITNDEKNIYIAIFSKDKGMQERILKAGVSIFFDKKGETNTKVVLNFPERNNESLEGEKDEYDSSKSSKKLFNNLDVFATTGFINTENGQHKINDRRTKIKLGLKMNMDSGLLYEAIIPIDEVLYDGLNAKNLKKNFSVGIYVHSLLKQNNYNQRGNDEYSRNDGYRPQIRPSISFGTGFGGMGGIGGIGIGMGGGMRGGGGRNYNRSNEPKQPEEILWYQFKFSDRKY